MKTVMFFYPNGMFEGETKNCRPCPPFSHSDKNTLHVTFSSHSRYIAVCKKLCPFVDVSLGPAQMLLFHILFHVLIVKNNFIAHS